MYHSCTPPPIPHSKRHILTSPSLHSSFVSLSSVYTSSPLLSYCLYPPLYRFGPAILSLPLQFSHLQSFATPPFHYSFPIFSSIPSFIQSFCTVLPIHYSPLPYPPFPEVPTPFYPYLILLTLFRSFISSPPSIFPTFLSFTLETLYSSTHPLSFSATCPPLLHSFTPPRFHRCNHGAA